MESRRGILYSMKKMVLTHSEKLFNNSNEDSLYSIFSRRSLRRMNVEIRTSFESDRGKRQGRRDLFDFYLYRWRVSAILKETGGASFPETSYFSPLCIHTRRNTATDIRRSRTDEYEGTRRRIDVIIGGGRKRERERDALFSYRRVYGYYVLLLLCFLYNSSTWFASRI